MGSPLILATTPAGPPALGGFSTPPSWRTPKPTKKMIAVIQMMTFMLSRIDCIMANGPRWKAYETGAAPLGRREKPDNRRRGYRARIVSANAPPERVLV